jgi:hypothetical protein
MKQLGIYPLGVGDNVERGVITQPQKFVRMNTLGLFKEMLPNDFEKGIEISFLKKPGFASIGKKGNCRSILVREPADLIKEMDVNPLLTLWWMCYRAVRGYMVRSGLLNKDQMLPFMLYEKLGLSQLGQRICDDFTDLNYPADMLQLHIDSNLVSNVIAKRLSEAWKARKDPDPILDLGQLLLVTKQDYRKLY